MPISRRVPFTPQMPLPSPSPRYVDGNGALDRFNAQNVASDADRRRDMVHAQEEAAIRRQQEQEAILAAAAMGALGGMVAGQGQQQGDVQGGGMTGPPSVATPGFNPDARSYGMDVARRMAGAGHGVAASGALEGVFAADQQQAAQKDKRYEDVLAVAASGDAARAQVMADRYGIQVPQELLRNGLFAAAFLQAGRIYDDPQQAAQFAQAMIRAGGDPQAAFQSAGPPRPKPQPPQPPKGTIIYTEGGQPMWAPHGGGALGIYSGVPEGTAFHPGGSSGQTDPNLSRARMLQNADLAGKAAAGPAPGDYASPEEVQAWQERYREAYEREMARATATAPQPSAADMPLPPSVPDIASGLRGGGAEPPPEAVRELTRNPSPRAIQEFDDVFGPGAAERVLDAEGFFGDTD